MDNFASNHVLDAGLLGFLLGSACQLQQAQLWPLEIYLLLLVLALLLLSLSRWLTLARWPSVTKPIILLLAFASLAFALAGWRASAFVSAGLDAQLEGRDIAVTGLVANMPQYNETGVRFRFTPESARLAGHAVRLPGKLELAWYAGVYGSGEGALEPQGELQRRPAALRAGDRWQFTVRLKVVHGGVNPFGFDYELWQWEQGVAATGYVRAGPHDPAPLRLAATYWHPLELARQQVRARIWSQVPETQAAGLIAALVVGDQGAIERADWNVFRATGVAHLMSISGLHITMFAWLAALLVGWLWRRSNRLCLLLSAPSAALLGGLALALAYALFSGWGVPAQRTLLMLGTLAWLRLLGARWPWPQVWLLACAVVVAADPWALLQAGFWLSFVAVGVLFATDLGSQRGKMAGLNARLRALWHEQWVITVALTPLTLLLFGQASMVSLLANALAIPGVTLLLTPLAMLGVLTPALWTLAAWLIAWFEWYLQLLVSWPWAVLWLAQAPWWLGLAGVCGALVLLMNWHWRMRLLGLPLLLPMLCWQPARPPSGEFELLAADVGQGSALLVRTAGHALLYDAGPRFSRESDAGQRVLVPLLRALDVRLDTLVLSHRDSDHTGGAWAILAQQPQATLLSSIDDDAALAQLRSVTRCAAGQHWRWDGVDFAVLHPTLDDDAAPRASNAKSCVLRVANAQRSALLGGDIPAAQELAMLQRLPSELLRADLLLVPHHGSKTSSSEEFLSAVQPRIALVQAGYRNRFGHPAPAVLARYRAHGVNLIDSVHCGAISWQSWHAEVVQCQRQRDAHYWHHHFASTAR